MLLRVSAPLTFCLASSCRCEESGELPSCRKRPGAGQRSTAGLRHVQLSAANRQVRSASPPASRDPCHQPAGRRIPLLQTPEWRRAVQQPAHWNATRQESLGEDCATHDAAVRTYWHPNEQPPAQTWLCYDLGDREHRVLETLVYTELTLMFKLQLEAQIWTNTFASQRLIMCRKTPYESLYSRKKKKKKHHDRRAASPQPHEKRHYWKRKKEHLKQTVHSTEQDGI